MSDQDKHIELLSKIVHSHNSSAIDQYFGAADPLPGPQSLSRSANPAPAVKNVRDGKTEYCTTTKYDITSNPDEIVLYSPDIDTIWLGALVQGSSLGIGIGSFKEVPFAHRAPLDITVDLLAAGNKITVNQPSAVESNNAIGELLDRLSKAKVKTGSNASFKFCETYSLEQSLVELGLSAHYVGAEFQAKHSETTSAERRVITVSFIEKCFTTFINNPSSPSALFTRDFTLDDIKLQESLGRVSKSSPPALLTTIAYGRMFYCTISSSQSMDELKDAVTASYNSTGAGGSAAFTEGHKKTLAESRFTVTTIGIPEDAVAAVIRSGNYTELLSTPMDIVTAKPISYIFRNLRDLSIASYVNGAEYAMTTCVPQNASGDVVARRVAIDARFSDFQKLVDAAADNRDDPPTRDERTRGYRLNHSLVIFNLEWLRDHAPALKGDDIDYCKDWLQQFVDTIKQQMVTFKSKHDNRPWAAGIYQEGYNDCAAQLSLAEAIRSGLKV